MKYFLLIIFSLSLRPCFTQGLNAELSFNNSYSQNVNSLVNVNEFSYFVLYEANSGSFFNTCSLIKTDTLGNIIWTVPLNLPSIETTVPQKIIPSADNEILIIGNAYPTCDVAMNCITYIQKYNESGNLIWTKTWIDEYCFNISVSGLSADTSTIFINYMQGDTSAILQFDYSGNLTDSLPISISNLIQIQDFGIFEKTAVTLNSLYGFDTMGNVFYSRGFGSAVKNFSTLNDTLYLLTSDSIFVFDTALQLLNATQIAGYSQFSNLKVSAEEIRFLISGVNEEYLLVLNHELQITNFLVFPEEVPTNTPKDFSDSHFTAAINFELYEYASIRHLDFSLQTNQNVTVNRTDIGVIDIITTQVSAIYYTTPNVYNYKIYANILIKNYGNQIANDCRINHYITMSICNHVVYSEHFSGLNLAPGDSLWLTCGLIHSNLDVLSGNDTLRKTICVYTSQPNFTTDLNVTNDHYCESIVVGYVSIEENELNEFEIYPNPVNSSLTISTEMLGEKNYEIYDMQGKLILSNSLASTTIDLNTLGKGNYLIRIYSADRRYNAVRSFIKE